MISFLTKFLKTYYKKKGYEIVLKKYKLMTGKYAQSIVLPRATYSPWVEDIQFQEIFKIIQKDTLVDIYRCYELWKLSEEVKFLDGEYLEVGV